MQIAKPSRSTLLAILQEELNLKSTFFQNLIQDFSYTFLDLVSYTMRFRMTI